MTKTRSSRQETPKVPQPHSFWDERNNVISLAEFRLAVRNPPVALKADNNEIDTLFKSFDADNSGTSLKEMVPFLRPAERGVCGRGGSKHPLRARGRRQDVATALREAAEAGANERLRQTWRKWMCRSRSCS